MNQLVKFEPQKTAAKEIALNAHIKFAAKIKDWPALERAIEQKVEEQRDFVAWWNTNVRGSGQPQKNSRSTELILSCDQAEEQTQIKHQQVSRWRKRLSNVDAYKSDLYNRAYRAAMAEAAPDSELVQQSTSNEHYTPQQYIEAARTVLGEIDLDPASCAEANKVIQAKQFFDNKSDGLKQRWYGRLWLNPPYGDLVGKFIAKLMASSFEAAIVLVNAHCTDTLWFQPLWDGVLCFTNHRVNFYGDETRSGSTHGSVFIYFGENKDKFAREFVQFGAVVGRYGNK